MESFRRMILHTAIVPGALSLAFAPPVALKKFIAVSHLDAPAVVEYDPPAPRSKTRQFVELVVVLGVEGLLFYAALKGTQTLSNSIFFLLVGGAYLASMFHTIRDLTGGRHEAVYRTDKGANEWRDLPFSTYSKLSYRLSIAGALTLTVAAFVAPSTLTSWALSFAVAHRYMASANAFRLSIRGILIVTCGYVAVCAVVFSITVPLVAWYLRKWPQDPSKKKDEDLTGVSPNVLAFIQPLSNITFFVLTGYLAATCYRFDYFLHGVKTAGIETAVVPETIDAPEHIPLSPPRWYTVRSHFSVGPAPLRMGEVPVLSRGVVIPSKAPKSFSKVYYSTVVSSWLAAQLGLAAALAFIPSLHGKTADGDIIRFMILSFPINIIVTSLAVVVVAKSRGELRALWTYIEAWRPVMKKREVVAADDVGDAVEEVDSLEKNDAEVAQMLLSSTPARDVKA